MSDCKETCAFHKERGQLIKAVETEINDSIGPAINQHKAYWKFFFWVVGIAISLIGYMTVSINSSVDKFSTVATRIERSVAIGQINYENNVMRLTNIEEDINDIDNRLRDIEVRSKD